MGFIDFQLIIQIGFTVALILSTLFVTTFVHAMIDRYGRRQKVSEKRNTYTKKLSRFIVFLLAAIGFSLIWGIDFKGVFIFASSFFAVVGIALFAAWSVLSNITTSFLLLFTFPYKIGDHVRILDSDNSVEGKLQDIAMFNLQIEDEKGNLIIFPNNLAIQKTVIRLAEKEI